MNKLSLDSSYLALLKDLRERIRTSQLQAARAVNNELIVLYFEIGKRILALQEKQKWGNNFVEQLSRDLRRHFPGMRGFSPTNLKYMRQFALEYQKKSNRQMLSGDLPWSHHIVLLQRVADTKQRLWYAAQASKNGWSYNTLTIYIEQHLYQRQAVSQAKTTNFQSCLPLPQSDLAEQTLKNPYLFDFLTVGAEAHERDIQKQLTMHITKFLLELGSGFAFVGQNYHVQVGDDDFYIDLLFYHLQLRCYVVIELKAKAFIPEYAGKLNFYLSIVDDKLKRLEDNPSIGLILCKTKNKTVAEYALKDMTKPIGVSEYKIIESLPKELQTSLPTIEELEAELNATDSNKKDK